MERDDLRPQRVWALRKGEHEAAIDLKAVPGIAAEIVLTVDGEWRKTRLFLSHEQAELVGAIADTRAVFEAIGQCSRCFLNERFPTFDPASRQRVACVPTPDEERRHRIYNDLLATPEDRPRFLKRHGITEGQLGDIEQEARANAWTKGSLCG
jgi:hypothetical protein